MISSKADYRDYLLADYKANNHIIEGGIGLIINILKELYNPDTIILFLKALRKVEYLTNCKTVYFRKLRRMIAFRKFQKLSRINGFTIPINTFGPGLSIAHRGTIVVNGAARIGANCRIHVCVNIGTAKDHFVDAPRIGNNVYIGPGAKIFGPIEIADDCVIGANAVVNKSCLIKGAKLLGIPARPF